MPKKAIGLFLSTLIFLSLFTTAIFGQSPSPSLKPQGLKDRLENKLEKRQSENCGKVTSRVTAILSNSDTKIENREKEAEKIKTNWQKRVDKFKEKGLDTSKLETDVIQLGTLLDTWLASFNSYIDALKATQNYTCGEAQGQFRDALKKSREAHKKVQQDRKAVRAFVHQTLRADLKALRDQWKSLKKTTPEPTVSDSVIE